MRNEYIYELDRKITFTFCSLSCKLLNANAECFIPASEICNNNVNASATVNSNDTLKNFRTAQSTDRINAQSSQLMFYSYDPHTL